MKQRQAAKQIRKEYRATDVRVTRTSIRRWTAVGTVFVGMRSGQHIEVRTSCTALKCANLPGMFRGALQRAVADFRQQNR